MVSLSKTLPFSPLKPAENRYQIHQRPKRRELLQRRLYRFFLLIHCWASDFESLTYCIFLKKMHQYILHSFLKFILFLDRNRCLFLFQMVEEVSGNKKKIENKSKFEVSAILYRCSFVLWLLCKILLVQKIDALQILIKWLRNIMRSFQSIQ